MNTEPDDEDPDDRYFHALDAKHYGEHAERLAELLDRFEELGRAAGSEPAMHEMVAPYREAISRFRLTTRIYAALAPILDEVRQEMIDAGKQLSARAQGIAELRDYLATLHQRKPPP